MILSIVKLPLSLITVLIFIVINSCRNLLIKDEIKRRQFQARSTSFFCKLLIRILGIDLNIEGNKELLSVNKNNLIVSNHLSYMDIFIIASVCPSIFITSVEMQNTPFLGTISKLGGSLFVERRNTKNLQDELNKAADLLKQGFNIVLFPEGTTGDGHTVMPFKRAFMHSAIKARIDILPVCLKYVKINGKPISPEKLPLVSWYDGKPFFAHFLRFITLRKVSVSLVLLDEIKIRLGMNSRLAAKNAFKDINRAYGSG